MFYLLMLGTQPTPYNYIFNVIIDILMAIINLSIDNLIIHNVEIAILAVFSIIFVNQKINHINSCFKIIMSYNKNTRMKSWYLIK